MQEHIHCDSLYHVRPTTNHRIWQPALTLRLKCRGSWPLAQGRTYQAPGAHVVHRHPHGRTYRSVSYGHQAMRETP